MDNVVLRVYMEINKLKKIENAFFSDFTYKNLDGQL